MLPTFDMGGLVQMHKLDCVDSIISHHVTCHVLLVGQFEGHSHIY